MHFQIGILDRLLRHNHRGYRLKNLAIHFSYVAFSFICELQAMRCGLLLMTCTTPQSPEAPPISKFINIERALFQKLQ